MEDGAEKYIPRGIRNNNPGNIKKNDVQWEGLASEDKQTDDVFFVFESPKWGIRALTKILLTYKTKYGLNNIWSIINRYAPDLENDTEAYRNFLVNETGYGMLQTIEHSIEGYTPLVKSIIKMENGIQPYDDNVIYEGMYLAFK